MKQKILKIFSAFLLLAAILSNSSLQTAGAVMASVAQEGKFQDLAPCAAAVGAGDKQDLNQNSALPCSPAASEQRLIPGGVPFGVKFSTEGVLVVGFCDIDTDGGKVNPAYAAGLRQGDVIRRLGDRPVSTAAALSEAMDEGGGAPFTVVFTRDGREMSATVTPVYSRSEGKYKSGIWIRDGGAGIGTVTFIDPDSGMFAGLGHGICDSDTGKLIPLQRGTVIDVTISGIVRGLPGTPGEVKGYFNSDKLGTVFGNTECGVFGLFTSTPAGCGEAIPVAERAEVHDGSAELLCALDTDRIGHYAVTISAINPTAKSNKCFTVTVTDPALIEKTGGIIQGMSGSPLIQDGKLIGAVTHVLVGDPTKGYGIFIDNMLEQMDRSSQ